MFKDKLIELRKMNNDTQEGLAFKLHVSRSLVAKWEQGRSLPSLNDLNKICEVYEIEFEQLLSKNELKSNYGIIYNNNRTKKYIIIALTCLSSILFIVGLLFLFSFPISKNISYKQMQIVEVTDNVKNDFLPIASTKNILLDDGTIVYDISLQKNDYNITFNGEKYSNVMLNYVSSGNYVKYRITKHYNIFNQVIKTEKDLISIDFNCPLLNSDDVYVVGAYIPLTDNLDYDEESCLFVNFTIEHDEFLLTGNLHSLSSFGGLVDIKSSLPYEKITCKFYLDKYKLYCNENNYMGEKKRPLIYVYSDGTTSFYPINNFTLEKKLREYHVDPWYINDSSNINDLSPYFIQNVKYERQSFPWSNIYLDFEIIDKDSPDYYELIEFNSSGNYIGKQYIHSFEDLNSLIFSETIDRLLLCEIKNDKIINSDYINKGDKIKVSFSNDYGIFSERHIIFN